MTSLLAVGIAVAVFGGLVLLKFPERPGGRIAWHGFEVSSVGAGMPLIVVGVAAVAIAALRGGNAVSSTGHPGNSSPTVSTSASGPSTGCSVFQGVPKGRVKPVEDGASALTVIGADQSKTGPFVLKLTENGKSIGAIRARWIASGSLFRVESVVDASCKPTESFSNASRSSDRHVLQSYDELRLRLGTRSYTLSLGIANGTIQVDHFERFRP